MALIGACKDGWTALRHSPGLVVAGLLVAAVGQFSTVGELVDSPVVSGLTGVGYFLAFPFVLGGTVGMALAAVRGADASLAEFVRAGRAYYARMLVALFLFVVILHVAVMGTFSFGFVALVALVVLGPVGQDVAFGTGVFLFAGSVALTLVRLALVVLFLQFFGPAIVVEDEGALASLSRSATVVRANLGRLVLLGGVVWALVVGSFVLSTVVTTLASVAFLVAGVNPMAAFGVLPVFLAAVALLVAPLLVLVFKLWLALEACVVGGYGPLGALRASWRLSTNHRGKLLGLLAGNLGGFGVTLVGPTLGAGGLVGSPGPLLTAVGTSAGELLSVVWYGAYAHLYVQSVLDA